MGKPSLGGRIYGESATIYDSVMTVFGYAHTVRTLIQRLKLELPPSPRILDLGCGTGLATEALTARFKRAEVTGLDSSGHMLCRYVKKFPKSLALQGDFNDESTFRNIKTRRRISLPAGSYDLVISSGAVSEYGDLSKVLPLILRLLKREGIFVNIGVKDSLVNKLSSKVWDYEPTTERKFVKALKACGFDDIRGVTMPTMLFPTNILKYAVRASKKHSALTFQERPDDDAREEEQASEGTQDRSRQRRHPVPEREEGQASRTY
jgi:ubiquinone/menaquinone biosynthesis C-methylase UbiE